MTYNASQNLVASAEVKAGAASEKSAALTGDNVCIGLNVSAGPRGNNTTQVRVMFNESLDGQTWGQDKFHGQIVNVSEAGLYTVTLDINAPYVRVFYAPMDYKITASVDASVEV
ncbi:hypothetical protein [Salinisphaera sp. LB1]|uniref:hypothetical protein n=1 Tax=Salinisphaera sp. LB1 TaxID=2183911 RepID=UPI000D70508B|nr:hypothetical protein [Salinisphaera sp. LB1]AWN17690.1 hypothetical protein SALB1_3496 [Salinisphaera sp. LB1]